MTGREGSVSRTVWTIASVTGPEAASWAVGLRLRHRARGIGRARRLDHGAGDRAGGRLVADRPHDDRGVIAVAAHETLRALDQGRFEERVAGRTLRGTGAVLAPGGIGME